MSLCEKNQFSIQVCIEIAIRHKLRIRNCRIFVDLDTSAVKPPRPYPIPNRLAWRAAAVRFLRKDIHYLSEY